jgi:hypothetical protein
MGVVGFAGFAWDLTAIVARSRSDVGDDCRSQYASDSSCLHVAWFDGGGSQDVQAE